MTDNRGGTTLLHVGLEQEKQKWPAQKPPRDANQEPKHAQERTLEQKALLGGARNIHKEDEDSGQEENPPLVASQRGGPIRVSKGFHPKKSIGRRPDVSQSFATNAKNGMGCQGRNQVGKKNKEKVKPGEWGRKARVGRNPGGRRRAIQQKRDNAIQGEYKKKRWKSAPQGEGAQNDNGGGWGKKTLRKKGKS